MRNKSRRWIFFWIFNCSYLQLIFCAEISEFHQNLTLENNDNPNPKTIFAPRMDYDQWKPLGRGDPLKNDPTYDYVPPVLDRVHYWIEPSARKPDPPSPPESQKTEILLLGVSSKKPSTGTPAMADSRHDNYDQFMKFVDGPKFNSHQRIARPHFTSYFPTALFKNKLPERGTYQKTSGEQRVPYTMLMPPPIITKKPPPVLVQKPLMQLTTNKNPVSTTPTYTSTQTPVVSSSAGTSTTPEVTIQAANLIYQSSSLSDEKEWRNKNQYVTITSPSSQINWTPSPFMYTTKKMKPYNEDIVFQKHIQPPQSYIQIDFSPSHQNSLNLTNKPLIASNSDHNINYVTPPPLIQSEEIMHKGQVSDDNLDISNTYVKIGKTEAQVHSTALDMSDNIPVMPPEMMVRYPSMVPMHHQRPNMHVYSKIKHPVPPMTPMTMQTIQSMQTMQPPPATTSPVYKKITNPILNALEKEKFITEPTVITTTNEDSSETTTILTTPTSNTNTVPQTSTTTSLTTDPLFKHYKQPIEPLRGPLYLIIQGHSKVKTYGPSKQIHGISVQETNEISDDKDEFQVKHLHGYKKEPSNNEERPRKGRSGNLQTLKHVIQTGLGSIDFSETNRRQDVKEAELEVGYQVGKEKEVTSEKYHKGIVEEARKLKNFENITEH